MKLRPPQLVRDAHLLARLGARGLRAGAVAHGLGDDGERRGVEERRRRPAVWGLAAGCGGPPTLGEGERREGERRARALSSRGWQRARKGAARTGARRARTMKPARRRAHDLEIRAGAGRLQAALLAGGHCGGGGGDAGGLSRFVVLMTDRLAWYRAGAGAGRRRSLLLESAVAGLGGRALRTSARHRPAMLTPGNATYLRRFSGVAAREAHARCSAPCRWGERGAGSRREPRPPARERVRRGVPEGSRMHRERALCKVSFLTSLAQQVARPASAAERRPRPGGRAHVPVHPSAAHGLVHRHGGAGLRDLWSRPSRPSATRTCLPSLHAEVIAAAGLRARRARGGLPALLACGLDPGCAQPRRRRAAPVQPQAAREGARRRRRRRSPVRARRSPMPPT